MMQDTTAAAVATQSDPWQPHVSVDANKHKPVVLESPFYGLVSAGLALLFVLYVLYVRPRKRCECVYHQP